MVQTLRKFALILMLMPLTAAAQIGILDASHGGTGKSSTPSPGQIPVGNAGGTAYNDVTVSGDATLTSSGVLDVTSTGGTPFTRLATLAGSTAGDIIYYNGSAWVRLAGNTSGTEFLSENSSGVPSWAASTGGVASINSTTGAFTFTGAGVSCTGTTCTFTGSGSGIGSITWALPSWLTASPSTISASGTQTFSASTQSANTVLAGPSSGVAATPAFRALVAADIPPINLASGVTGTLPVANGGTGTSTPGLIAGANVTITGSWPDQTINSSAGMVYPGAGIPNSTGSAWGTSYGAQGTDANLMTSGTVSGTSVNLCTDANGGATTVGCPSGSGVASINTVTGAFTFTGSGVSCSGATCTFTGGGGSVPANSAYLGGNASGAAVAVSPTNRVYNAVLDLSLNSTGASDDGAALNTLLNHSSQCSGSTTTNCVPSYVYLPPGVYKIVTPVHATGSAWRNMVFDCGSAASNFGNGGQVVFWVDVPAGDDGMWFDPASAVWGAPKFKGCSFVDGIVYNPLTRAFGTTVSDTRSLLHFSNVNDYDEDNNSFSYAVGDTFNPNSMNGGTLPTSGYSCSVTLDNYVVTCSVPSGTSAATVAMFGESNFLVNDVGGTGRPYAQEIYQASLSGTTLTIYLATPYQHKTNSALYAWLIHYNGHGVLIDGFGQVRTANGNTGTVDGYSQYGEWRGTFAYCDQFPLWMAGGGVQSYLSGGRPDGSGGGVQSVDLYGVSRVAFIGGFFKNSCPSNSNVQAPNGEIADAIASFMGGYGDTYYRLFASNSYPFDTVVENSAHNTIGGWMEDTGTTPYSKACSAALGQESCLDGVVVGGDLASGSHAIANDIQSYILNFGRAVEILPTAKQTKDNAMIALTNGTNIIDLQLPSPGDPNCASATNCQGLTSTDVRAGGIYRNWVVSPPTPGGACTMYYQVEHGTDGHDYTCNSSLVWVQH